MTPSEEPKKLELQTQAVAPIPRVPLNEMLALVRDTELVATYGREIIESQLAINRFDQDWRLARVFAESGLFADAQAVNQAMTKVQLGRSWNMEAADAMRFIFFVNGKPSVENEYLAAKMRDAGLDWEIEWHANESGLCTGCTLWPSRLMPDGSWLPIMDRKGAGKIPASVTFGKVDADRIPHKQDGKWVTLSEKQTYQSFPGDMYYWRAISRLRKRYATNVLSGAMMRDEAEEIAVPQIEAPRERQTVAPTELTPGRQARRRAGAEDVVGTVKPEPATAGDGTKPEPPSETTAPSAETKPAPPLAELPWKGGKAGMDQVLGALRIHVGPKAYMEAMVSGGWVEADLKPEGGASVKFYERLRALPPEPAAPTAPVAPLFTGEALPWVDQPSMIAAFRVQRELIGVLEFEKILNSKAGFTFGNSSWEDATALEIYRAMVAAPAAEKPKKLF